MRGLIVRTALVLTAALLVVPSATFAQEDQSPVMGAWLLTGTTNPDGVQHPGLYIYTSTHYSTMFVYGDEARGDSSIYPGTDADKLAAYNSFIANSGRYEIDGDQITTRAYVSLFPNYMHTFPDNAYTYAFAIDGDVMTLTFTSGASATLRRVEGMEYASDE